MGHENRGFMRRIAIEDSHTVVESLD